MLLLWGQINLGGGDDSVPFLVCLSRRAKCGYTLNIAAVFKPLWPNVSAVCFYVRVLRYQCLVYC